jgi:hypothetical protein
MTVFREQTFKYKGQPVTMTPSLALLRRIKGQGVNNVVTATKCLNGGLDLEDLVIVHVAFLQAGGVNITEDESYAYLSGDNVGEVLAFQMAYVESVLPSVDLGKKRAAPAKATGTSGGRKKT